MEEILKFFCIDIRKDICNYNFENLEEIKIRVNKPIILKYHNNEVICDYIPTMQNVLHTMQMMCDNSIYSYQKQICNGYITLKGGHRVGISGSVVTQDEKIININYISSLNFRIARQVFGSANNILKYILKDRFDIYNTLIVSPPGCGKTTILRDAIRQLSNGINNFFVGQTVGVVDERGEISAMYKGVSQNDLGIRTDIMENVEKSLGMKNLIRSMNPKILCTDEIGTEKDIDAINYAVCSGVNMIFTAHGRNFNDIILNPSIKQIIDKYLFERIIFLNRGLKPGKIEKVYTLDLGIKKYVEEEFENVTSTV